MTDKAKWTREYINSLPDASFLYIEPKGKKDAEGRTAPRSLRHLPIKDSKGRVDLPHLRNAISRLGQAATGKGWMSEGLRKRLLAKAQKLLQGKRSTDGNKEAEEIPLTLWKEEDTGRTRFLAVFSNNYRDDDHPPEILSKDAHLDFVRAVDAGEWPYPELWNWHVEGTRFGETDYLAFDEDSGFILSMGLIDEGKEHIAQKCVELGDVLSHGMPQEEIRRDDDDPTIITRYRSTELSTLPQKAAANKHTMFAVVKNQEEGMNMSDEKVEALLERGVDVDALAQNLDQAKTQAEQEGRESKEAPPENGVEAVETEVVAEVEPEMEDAQDDEEKEVAPDSSGAPTETVVNTVQFDPTAVAAEISSILNDTLTPIVTRLEQLEGQVKALSETPDPDPTKEMADMTPAASFGALVRSMVIGKEETRVDGRKENPRTVGPKETDPGQSQSRIGIDFVDKMLSGEDWRESVPQ